jgi:hypothetical protein|tara:strand:- start:4972 stop:5376 length:405 start_codon:yes stop_codon:yes gene_type:complete
MAVTKKRLQAFITLASTPGSCSYNAENKQKFLRDAKAILRDLAGRMGFERGDYDLRTNKAGIAVSGEVTLHGDGLYVQFGQFYTHDKFLFRGCRGTDDYVGLDNRWMSWSFLSDLDEAAAVLKRADNAVVSPEE